MTGKFNFKVDENPLYIKIDNIEGVRLNDKNLAHLSKLLLEK